MKGIFCCTLMGVGRIDEGHGKLKNIFITEENNMAAS